MFIADMYHNIKDTEEFPLEDGMVERLDEMLTEYKVDHFFSLPHPSDIDKDETASLMVGYDSKDDVTFFLVYALWLKSVRNAPDEMINKAMLRHCADA